MEIVPNSLYSLLFFNSSLRKRQAKDGGPTIDKKKLTFQKIYNCKKTTKTKDDVLLNKKQVIETLKRENQCMKIIANQIIEIKRLGL